MNAKVPRLPVDSVGGCRIRCIPIPQEIIYQRIRPIETKYTIVVCCDKCRGGVLCSDVIMLERKVEILVHILERKILNVDACVECRHVVCI